MFYAYRKKPVLINKWLYIIFQTSFIFKHILLNSANKVCLIILFKKKFSTNFQIIYCTSGSNLRTKCSEFVFYLSAFNHLGHYQKLDVASIIDKSLLAPSWQFLKCYILNLNMHVSYTSYSEYFHSTWQHKKMSILNILDI